MKKIIGLCAILLTFGLVVVLVVIGSNNTSENAVATFKDDGKIDINEYYNMLKDEHGVDALMALVDTYILETEFADYVETAKETADLTVNSYISTYGEEEFLEILQQYYGYQSIDDYRDLMYLSALRNRAIEEYTKLQITDEEIEQYYNDIAIGDMELSYIFITSNVSNNASDSEIEQAEEATQATIDGIMDRLYMASGSIENLKSVFAKLAQTYSEDEDTKADGGNLGRINYGVSDGKYDELVRIAAELEVGEFIVEATTSEPGYYIILKTAQYEKESLENERDEIRDILVNNYITENSTSAEFYSLQYYRNKYGMDIVDDEFAKQYSNYIQNLEEEIKNAETTPDEEPIIISKLRMGKKYNIVANRSGSIATITFYSNGKCTPDFSSFNNSGKDMSIVYNDDAVCTYEIDSNDVITVNWDGYFEIIYSYKLGDGTPQTAVIGREYTMKDIKFQYYSEDDYIDTINGEWEVTPGEDFYYVSFSKNE